MEKGTYRSIWQHFKKWHGDEDYKADDDFLLYIAVADKVLTALTQAHLIWNGFGIYARLRDLVPTHAKRLSKNVSKPMQFQLTAEETLEIDFHWFSCGKPIFHSKTLATSIAKLDDSAAYCLCHQYFKGKMRDFANAIRWMTFFLNVDHSAIIETKIQCFEERIPIDDEYQARIEDEVQMKMCPP